MVNGAFGYMATMDINEASTKRREPANFLDVMVAAPPARKVTAAFKIIMARPQREGHPLVNIFGGIAIRCDVLAEGVVAAAVKEVGLSMPLVVRLEGTNAEPRQQQILGAIPGFNVTFANDLADGVLKIVVA